MESLSKAPHGYFLTMIELNFDDEAHSAEEDRYNTIGDISSGNLTTIGNLRRNNTRTDDILFVVYTERASIDEEGRTVEITRLISARLATSFERGVYYGKHI